MQEWLLPYWYMKRQDRDEVKTDIKTDIKMPENVQKVPGKGVFWTFLAIL